MKYFKNENEYGNMKTDGETYEGILLKTGDEGYRYYSSSGDSSNGSSYNCSYCHDTGWIDTSISCSHCNAGNTKLGELTYTYTLESREVSIGDIKVTAECPHSDDMYVYIRKSLYSDLICSEHKPGSSIEVPLNNVLWGTYYVTIIASSDLGEEKKKQFTIELDSRSSIYDCIYCKDSGWISGNKCGHCNKWQTNLAPITSGYNCESYCVSRGNINVIASCANATDLYVDIYKSTSTNAVYSEHVSMNNINTIAENLDWGTYIVNVRAKLYSYDENTTQFQVTLDSSSLVYDCLYCNDSGWIENTRCSNCEAWKTNYKPLNITCKYNATSNTSADLSVSVNCLNTTYICFNVYGDDLDNPVLSAEASTNNVSKTMTGLEPGTYTVIAEARVISPSYVEVSRNLEVLIEDNESGVISTYDCPTCHDYGLITNDQNQIGDEVCTECSKGDMYLSPIFITHNFTDLGSCYEISCDAACDNAYSMSLYLYNEAGEILNGIDRLGKYVSLSTSGINEGTYTIWARSCNTSVLTRTQTATIVISEE